jgi:hypothetical protein
MTYRYNRTKLSNQANIPQSLLESLKQAQNANSPEELKKAMVLVPLQAHAVIRDIEECFRELTHQLNAAKDLQKHVEAIQKAKTPKELKHAIEMAIFFTAVVIRDSKDIQLKLP